VGIRELIARRSVRSFAGQSIPTTIVQSLIDVARWTGSARNRQPWRFVAVYDEPTREALARLGAYGAHLAHAPVVLVVLGPTERQLDTEFDLGRVAQSVTLAAAEQGLGSCIVSLFPDSNALAAAALVGGDDGLSARHAIALGRPARTRPTGSSAIPLGRHDTDELLRFL